MEFVEFEEMKKIGESPRSTEQRLTRSCYPLRVRKQQASSKLDDSLRAMAKVQTRRSVGPIAFRSASKDSDNSTDSDSSKDTSSQENGTDNRVTRSKSTYTPKASQPVSDQKQTPKRQTRQSVGAAVARRKNYEELSFEGESSESEASEVTSDSSETESDAETSPRPTRSRVTLTPKLAAMSLRTPTTRTPAQSHNGTPTSSRASVSRRGSRLSLRRNLFKTPRGSTTPKSASRKLAREKVATPAFRSAAFEGEDGEAECEPLPCREKEFEEIRTFILTRLRTATSGCMYVSGVPGTGKTATVCRVVHSLLQDAEAHGQRSEWAQQASVSRKSLASGVVGRGRGRGRGRPRKSMPLAVGDRQPAKRESCSVAVPAFKFVELNGIVLSRPNEVYVQLWRALSGKKLPAEKALRALDSYFTGSSGAGRLDSNANAVNKSSAYADDASDSDSDGRASDDLPCRMPVVVLVDEIDLLRTRKQEVLYTLFDWPTANDARLIIVAIANLMNLPDTLLIRRIASRLGLGRVPFSPYTWNQLYTILCSRFADTRDDELRFGPEALEFVARKVAAVSGDVRRALEICKFSIQFEREARLERSAQQTNELHDGSPKRTRRHSRVPNEKRAASARDDQKQEEGAAHDNLVTVQSVNRAIARMNSSLSVIETIRALPEFHKLFLKAVLVESASRHAHTATNEGGVTRTTNWQHSAVSFGSVYRQFGVLCHYEDFSPVPSADCVAHLIVGPLAASRFVSVERPHLLAHALIRLLVNADDLQLAVNS